ncbi:MAG TPA: immunoglobulin domain-containing protein, partial [Candidatus Hydrogenedentes bacterium]|nr:immunoglobulin domain-containing protein [Candidatus Hydrogenedentota bacterium]
VSSPSFNWETESNAAVLRVSAPLVLLDRPADVQAYVTDPVFQLRVHFEGGMPGYSSQWRRSGLDPVSPEVGAGTGTIILGDPNTTVLAVSPASLSPGLYAYAAELTDQVKTTRSDVGTVEIANNLQFVRGLTNQAVRARQRFEWSIEVSGGLGGVHYQWYKFEAEGGKAFVPIVDDGAHYGAQTSSLTFVEVAAEDDGLYLAEASDDFTIISSEAYLTVGTALPALGLGGLALLTAASALFGAARLRRRGR